MRIQVRLPEVKPDEYVYPEECPRPGCGSSRYQHHGKKTRQIEDMVYDEVVIRRCRCAECGKTFRVYPKGITNAGQSLRLKAMSVLLYVLGLSYGAVSDYLRASGAQMSKTSAYYNVQDVGARARRKTVKNRQEGGQRPAIGSDGTYVKVKGELTGIEVVVDDESGELLGLDIIVSEKYDEIKDLITDIAKEVDAEVLVSDDLDSYKQVADEAELAHQICQSHIIRNLEKVGISLLNQNDQFDNIFPIKRKQLLKDLNTLGWLVRDCPRDAKQFLAHLFDRYRHAPLPLPGKKHPVAFRMKRLVGRLWGRWERITLEQHYDNLDGTNNASERLIGWWIKERYRTMRGYKRTLSIRHVVCLTALLGANSGFDMETLYA